MSDEKLLELCDDCGAERGTVHAKDCYTFGNKIRYTRRARESKVVDEKHPVEEKV